MLLEQKVEVKLNGSNIGYFENLGYEIPRRIDKKGRLAVKNGTAILVDIHDLTKGSNALVIVECDYCGKQYKIKYNEHYNNVIKGVIQKVACWDCSKLKLEESNLKQFGVHNTFQREDIKLKTAKSMIKKYGVIHANQNQRIISVVAEKNRLSVDEVYRRFIKQGFIPLFKPEDYKYARQILPYKCKIHPIKTYYASANNVGRLLGCPQCFNERNKGENHYNWNGGVSNLSQYIRDKLIDWKNDSMKKYNYKCAITNDRFNVVHHVYGFNMILGETLKNLNLDIRPEVNMYTYDELQSIIDECKNLHIKYGLGVPLSNDIHNLFHNLYGQGNNTPEQFEEFKTRYRFGEFEEVLNKAS